MRVEDGVEIYTDLFDGSQHTRTELLTIARELVLHQGICYHPDPFDNLDQFCLFLISLSGGIIYNRVLAQSNISQNRLEFAKRLTIGQHVLCIAVVDLIESTKLRINLPPESFNKILIAFKRLASEIAAHFGG